MWVMAAFSAPEIRDAALTLGITDRASLNEINHRFRELARKWHPDVSVHDQAQSHEMFIRLKEAHGILVDYCMNCEISFRLEDILKTSGQETDEFWRHRFGEDPIWG